MPRYRRHFVAGRPVFLTLVCHARKPWLGEVGARAIALEALDDARRLHPFRHHGHVLLDDHLHLMLTPAPGPISRCWSEASSARCDRGCRAWRTGGSGNADISIT